MSAQRGVEKSVSGTRHLGESLFCVGNGKYYIYAGGADVCCLTQSAFIEGYCRIHYDHVEISEELSDYAE